MDGPFVRYFLQGEKLEIWRRDCQCATDCNCWEFDKLIPATNEHKAIFAQAAAYSLPKPPATSPPEDDAIQRIAEPAQAAPRWRKWGEDTA